MIDNHRKLKKSTFPIFPMLHVFLKDCDMFEINHSHSVKQFSLLNSTLEK